MKAKAKVFAVLALDPATGQLSILSAATTPEAAELGSIAGSVALRADGWRTAHVVGEIEVPVTTPEGYQFTLAEDPAIRDVDFVNGSDEGIKYLN